MEEKEKLDLRKNDSFMELKNLIKHTSLSDHIDTTDSFSDTTIEKYNHATEDSEYVTDDSNEENVLPVSMAIAITNLVKKLVKEYTRPTTVLRTEHNFDINADTIKQIIHDKKDIRELHKTNKKNKKEALKTIRLNTIVDTIKNHVDKILITEYDKIILAAQKNKYQYKIYKLPYHHKNPLIDDILNALNNYKGFEYIAYVDSGAINKPYLIYIKLDYIWD